MPIDANAVLSTFNNFEQSIYPAGMAKSKRAPSPRGCQVSAQQAKDGLPCDG